MHLKYKKWQNLHNFSSKLPTSVGVKMHIFTVIVYNNTLFFYSFFFYLSFVRLLLFPNIHNSPAAAEHKKKRRTTQPPTHHYHNLAPPNHHQHNPFAPPQNWPKIKGKLNQNQHKQLEIPTQNQAKPTRKPDSKSIQTHWKPNSKTGQTHRETQLKINSNPPENPSQIQWKTHVKNPTFTDPDKPLDRPLLLQPPICHCVWVFGFGIWERKRVEGGLETWNWDLRERQFRWERERYINEIDRY